MSKTFIIAEAACTWLHAGLEGACRAIRAAKECGADAFKTQWTSDPEAMAMRRGVARDKYTRLAWSGDVLPRLKEECDRVGIEFMCTVFIPKDIPTIAKYVSRFKVSAFESDDHEFLKAHDAYTSADRFVVVSYRRGKGHYLAAAYTQPLYVVSEYPTPLEHLGLSELWSERDSQSPYIGLSDHTYHVFTGAMAVAAGARVIEAHVRLSDTPADDPDYGHSHRLDGAPVPEFKAYVENVRLAERML